MTIRIGTCCFVSKSHATDYYYAQVDRYADAVAMVEQKIADGEIYIGKPDLRPGERLTTIDKGTRYCLVVEKI